MFESAFSVRTRNGVASMTVVRMSRPVCRAASIPAETGSPAGTNRLPRPTGSPASSNRRANVPDELPPKMNPCPGPPPGSGCWRKACARSSSCFSPVVCSDRAATEYRANPRTASTTRVVRPLHRTRRRRTPRMSRASAARARSSAGSPVAVERTPSGIVQTVPDPANRLDPVALAAKLGPEVMDVGVDGIRRDRDAERPRLIEELVPAEGLAGMAEQGLEEGELARAEIDGPIVDRDRAGRLVERDRAGHETWLRSPGGTVGASGEGSQASRQLVVGERLDEVVVRSRIEADDTVADGVAGRQHEDREIAPLRPDPACDLEAGDVRQADIEDDDVDAVLTEGDLEAGFAVGRALDVVAVLFEEPGERSAEALVVLDEEDFHEGLGNSNAGRCSCRR